MARLLAMMLFDLEKTRAWLEIVAHGVEIVALFGAGFAVYRWFWSRLDRSTTVLLQLESHFKDKDIRDGRYDLENDEEYGLIVEALTLRVRRMPMKSKLLLRPLDELLGFYVVLCGVRAAKQVQDKSLRACYRYWLCHYYRCDRREFRAYVDSEYPTLKAWLAQDRKLRDAEKWFRPGEFWASSDYDMSEKPAPAEHKPAHQKTASVSE